MGFGFYVVVVVCYLLFARLLLRQGQVQPGLQSEFQHSMR